MWLLSKVHHDKFSCCILKHKIRAWVNLRQRRNWNCGYKVNKDWAADREQDLSILASTGAEKAEQPLRLSSCRQVFFARQLSKREREINKYTQTWAPNTQYRFKAQTDSENAFTERNLVFCPVTINSHSTTFPPLMRLYYKQHHWLFRQRHVSLSIWSQEKLRHLFDKRKAAAKTLGISDIPAALISSKWFRSHLMMVSESCRPSRLRHSSSLQRQMMSSRAKVGMIEPDRSIWTTCKELYNGKERKEHFFHLISATELNRALWCEGKLNS